MRKHRTAQREFQELQAGIGALGIHTVIGVHPLATALDPWDQAILAIRCDSASLAKLTHRLGGATVAMEVRAPTEEQKELVQKYASFMHSFIGRGVCELSKSLFCSK
jgi:hypothetical protein